MENPTTFGGFFEIILFDNLLVDFPFGTMLIEAHVKNITQRWSRITKNKVERTGLLENVPTKKYAETAATTQQQPVDRVKSSSTAMNHCPVYRPVVLKIRTKMPVLVRTDDRRVAVRKPHDSLRKFRKVYMARGISEITLGSPFCVLLRNLFIESAHTPKERKIAGAVDQLDRPLDATLQSNHLANDLQDAVDNFLLYWKDKSHD